MAWLRMLREWNQRLLGALHFGRRDRDLEEELRLHIELAAEEARRRVVDAREALSVAKDFGIRRG